MLLHGLSMLYKVNSNTIRRLFSELPSATTIVRHAELRLQLIHWSLNYQGVEMEYQWVSCRGSGTNVECPSLHCVWYRNAEKKIFIQMKYIWFYYVYMLIVNSLYLLKYKWHIISKRWIRLQEKIHIHDWLYFEYMVTKNMEICDLNSYTHDLSNILFKYIE